MIQETSEEKQFYWNSTNSSTNGIYRDLLGKLNTSSIYQALQIQDFHIWISAHVDVCVLGFFSCNPRYIYIYKAYFKSHLTRIRRPRVLFSLWEVTCLYAIRFCNQVLLDLHYWWSEELCNQQHPFKLMELVTYWDPCKNVSHRLEICALTERRLLQDQV